MLSEEKVREDGVTKNVLEEAKLIFIHDSLNSKSKIVCVDVC